MSEVSQPASASSSGGGRRKAILIMASMVGLAVAVVVLVVALKGGDEPEQVARDYIDASFTDDLAFCELWTQERREHELELSDADDCEAWSDQWSERFEDDYGEEFDAYVNDLDVEIEVDDVDERENDADVTLTVTVRYGGDNEGIMADYFDGEKRSADEWRIALEKENGEWKVASHELA